MRLRRGLATLIGTLLATVPLPAAAHADSIVYLKGGHVWIANADGSGARAFTLHRYGWASPSEADNGTVVVAGGLSRVNADGTDSDGSSELYRFAPDGNQIGKPIPTYGSYSSPSCPYYPPSSVRVSPDGAKIAYGILDCGAGGENVALWTPATATGLSFPNQTRGQVDFTEPIWIDSNRFAISHSGPPVFGAHFGEHAIGDGDNVGAGWSEPAMDDDTAHAVISRSGKFAAVFYEDSAGWTDGKPRSVSLWLYSNPAMPANFTAGYGDPICKVTLNASRWVRNVSATLSPDGTKLLWGDSNGVEVAPVTSGCAAVVPHLLVPGGSEPFYARGNMQKGAAHPHQPGSSDAHATFKVKTKHPRAHRKVKFAGGGHMHSYRWKFGDGRTGKGRTVSHKYRKAGRYTVTLTVTDSSGAKAKVKHKIRVKR